MATTMSATKVAVRPPALARVTGVPGSSTGYWATPQPQTTAATPSAAMTRVRACQPGRAARGQQGHDGQAADPGYDHQRQ